MPIESVKSEGFASAGCRSLELYRRLRAARRSQTLPSSPPLGAYTSASGLPPMPSTTDRAYRASLNFFLAPLVPLLDDESISEVMVNGPDAVFVERGGKIERAAARFRDEEDLRAAANNIAQFVGKTIDDDHPMLDGRLEDGSRVCIVLHPLSAHGTSINIRRFSKQARTPQFLLDVGSM
ncbi:MAG: ATPase, T2SS/T4P/T4SS family, partial [Planctomycetota bacterium]